MLLLLFVDFPGSVNSFNDSEDLLYEAGVCKVADGRQKGHEGEEKLGMGDEGMESILLTYYFVNFPWS